MIWGQAGNDGGRACGGTRNMGVMRTLALGVMVSRASAYSHAHTCPAAPCKRVRPRAYRLNHKETALPSPPEAAATPAPADRLTHRAALLTPGAVPITALSLQICEAACAKPIFAA